MLIQRTTTGAPRNKHIQRALVEAAKLAPRQSLELAVIYDKEKRKEMGIGQHLP